MSKVKKEIKMQCPKCGWVSERSIKFLNIEEGAQGEDVLEFKCKKCGTVGKSRRYG